MQNPYAILDAEDPAPMDREAFQRLIRTRAIGRGFIFLGVCLFIARPADVEILDWSLSLSELSGFSLLLGLFFLTRALRCRTQEFQRMSGFVRYERLESLLEQSHDERAR